MPSLAARKMVSTRAKLLLIAGSAGATVHALSPVAPHRSRLRAAVARPTTIDVFSRHGRAARLGRSSAKGFRRSVVLYYRDRGGDSVAAAYNDTATTASLPVMTPLVGDTDGEGILHAQDESSPLMADLSAQLTPTTDGAVVQRSKGGSFKSESHEMAKEIATIALPSLGGMLLDPIMSLVDTACVGQVSITT